MCSLTKSTYITTTLLPITLCVFYFPMVSLQIQVQLPKNSNDHFTQTHNLPFPFCGIGIHAYVPFRIVSLAICGNQSLIVVDFCLNLRSIVLQRCKYVFPRWIYTNTIMLIPYCCSLITSNRVPQNIITTKTIFQHKTYAIALPMFNNSQKWINIMKKVLEHKSTTCVCLGIAKECFVLSCSMSIEDNGVCETIDNLTTNCRDNCHCDHNRTRN